MSNHTPGPWMVAGADFDSGTIQIETVQRGTDVPSKGYHIADVLGDRTDSPNAILIAIAPDMLALLRRISIYCDAEDDAVGTEVRALLARIDEEAKP